MNHKKFWSIIDKGRQESNGDMDMQIEAIGRQLERFSEDEIISFQEIFEEYFIRAYDWKLWAAAHLIGGGCSDDGFMDFRGWLISKGEKVFEDALQEPDTLVNVINEEDGDCQFEGFYYIAIEVWANKTGKDIEDFPPSELEHPDFPSGEEWDEDEGKLRKMLPKLWAAFG